jgi:hypothetical protein
MGSKMRCKSLFRILQTISHRFHNPGGFLFK